MSILSPKGAHMLSEGKPRIRRPIVCGGRAFQDRDFVFRTLDALNVENNFLHITQGGCKTGADKWARDWAASRMVEYRNFAANWTKYGRAAGPIRNQRMIDEENPDGCIAFPGGDGTADMKRRAVTHGIPVVERAPSPPGAQSASPEPLMEEVNDGSGS